MTSLQNGKLTIKQISKMLHWKKCDLDKMQIDKLASQSNGKLAK